MLERFGKSDLQRDRVRAEEVDFAANDLVRFGEEGGGTVSAEDGEEVRVIW